jgi:undecaprenyl-diphosphatase
VSLLQLVVLTVIQGITEFLPISSSGHLALVPALIGWPDQGLDIDVAVHVGTLLAVLVYFWRDVWNIVAGVLGGRGPERALGRRLFGYLVLGTIPVIAAGAALALGAPNLFRSAEVIAWANIVFAVLLFLADRFGATLYRLQHMRLGAAMAIGVSQVLALIPGTSRSGITMTVARALGFERRDAARYSMLLSIPTIIAAGVLSGRQIAERGDPVLTETAGLAVALSFVTALIAVAFLMRLLRSVSFTPFVVYRLLLGAALLVWLYGYP